MKLDTYWDSVLRYDQANWFKWLSIRDVPVLISTGTLAVLTKVFRCFPQFLLSVVWIVPQIRSLSLSPFYHISPNVRNYFFSKEVS